MYSVAQNVRRNRRGSSLMGCDIMKWAIRSNVSHKSTKQLLTILQSYDIDVPRDPRTLLSTPRERSVQRKANGYYYYFGLEECLNQALDYLDETPAQVDIQVNVDGARLPFTDRCSIWPILVKICKMTIAPMVVCVFVCRNKPKPVEDYLEEFNQELEALLRRGMFVRDKFVVVNLQAFICDAPARAHLKKIKPHNSYNSCERCTVRGIQACGSRAYIVDGSEVPRTDSDFDSLSYSDGQTCHQVGVSPLIGLVPCVSGFVLDSMHLVFLGVVKRLVSSWRSGFGNRARLLSENQVQVISQQLQNLRGHLPSEMARQPALLNNSDTWKATECREFILYLAPYVMKKFLPPDHYKALVALSIAIYILCDEDNTSRVAFLDYAKQLLHYFVSNSEVLYSQSFVSYNVHSLLHIADDVQQFNCSLNDISAFPFESYQHFLVALLRGSRNPAQQIVNRLIEQKQAGFRRHLTTCKAKVSESSRDHCYFLRGNNVIFITNVLDDGFMGYLVHFSKFDDAFNCGIISTKFKIGTIRKTAVWNSITVKVQSCDFACKAVSYPCDDHFVVIPLAHYGRDRVSS